LLLKLGDENQKCKILDVREKARGILPITQREGESSEQMKREERRASVPGPNPGPNLEPDSNFSAKNYWIKCKHIVNRKKSSEFLLSKNERVFSTLFLLPFFIYCYPCYMYVYTSNVLAVLYIL